MRAPRLREALAPTHRFLAILLVILVAGAVLQALDAGSLWAQEDEGEYIQAAFMVSHGGNPLVTFPTRPEPILLFAMAPIIYIFGPTLLVGRAVMIGFNLVTATSVALLTRRVAARYAEIAGLAAAAIYLLAPWPALQGPTVTEEPVAALFLTLSLYFLLRPRWTQSPWNHPAAGLLLGIAILSRRSSLVVGLVWIGWIIYTEGGWRNRATASLKMILPGAILVGGYFAYIVSATSFVWVYLTYSVHSAAYEYVPNLGDKAGVLAYMMFMVAPLFFAGFALAINLLRGTQRVRAASAMVTLSIAGIIALLVSYPYERQWGLGEIFTSYAVLSGLLGLTIFFWLVLSFRESLTTSVPAPVRGDVFVLALGWGVAILGLDFFARPLAFGVYFYDLLAPLSIFFGLWFVTLIPTRAEGNREALGVRRGRVSPARRYAPPCILILLMVVSSSAIALLVLGPTNPENVPGAYGLASHTIYRIPPSELDQVGAYLKDSMRSNDTIFSFDTGFLDAAGRTLSPPMAQYVDNYVSYLQHGEPVGVSPYPGAPKGFLPSILEMLAFWNNTHLAWIVEGPLTLQALEASPLLQWYLKAFYIPVTSFGDPLSFDQAVIFHRGTLPRLQANLTARLAIPTGPLAAAEYNGTMYVTASNASNLLSLGPDGKNGSLPLAFDGARIVATYFGELWIGSLHTPQVEVLPLDGSPPEVMTLGGGASALVGDTPLTEIYVSTASSGNIVAFGMTGNHTWWQPLWNLSINSPISAIAVNESSQRLYVGLPNNHSLMMVNATTGRVLAWVSLPFSPSALVYAGGGLVASSSGTVDRLEFVNGSSEPVLGDSIRVASNLQGLQIVGGLDAVATPSPGGQDLTFLDARSLRPLGVFQGLPCPTAVVWDPTRDDFGTLAPCQKEATWWHAPPPTQVVLSGPMGSSLTLNGDPTPTYALPVSLYFWPAEVTFSLTHAGYLPGSYQTTIATLGAHLSLTLSLGPSLAGIAALQNTFTGEVLTASAFAYPGALALVVWGPRWFDDVPPSLRGPAQGRSSAPESQPRPAMPVT